MRFLLDTHTLLWFMDENKRLSQLAKAVLSNPLCEVFVSDVSFFEISIKVSLNKLNIKRSLTSFISQTSCENFTILPIRHEHIIAYNKIDVSANHRDPFDRLLIATALHEQLDIITADEKFDYYKDFVRTVW